MRRAGAGVFALPQATVAREARPMAPPMAPASIDALLAMQGIEDSTERRRRSVAKGRSALDALDDLKLGLLSGRLTPATIARLQAAAAELKSSSGDPGLDSVLAAIQLRVEVEIAKAGYF